jgi:acetyltransferase-like isoleucine patch superfamily enzyme
MITTKQKILRVLRALFSITFIKDSAYSFLWHLIGHTYGMIRVNKGRDVKIRPNALLFDPERIYIGDNTRIGAYNMLWGGKESAVIKIGSNVATGPNVKIIAFDHGTEMVSIPITDQPTTEKDIFIGDNVWIGANAIITAGCNIGNGVVVAAGSVVTRDIPDNTICAGVPAKVIKKR